MNSQWILTRQQARRGFLSRLFILSIGSGLLACAPNGFSAQKSGQDESNGDEANMDDEYYAQLRDAMVQRQLKARGISNPRVLEAMGKVPRHELVPPDLQDAAYEDRPLPIGQGQTISQPYIVALMTELAEPEPGEKALDVGTGSGYQAAVLAELVDHVYSIEIHEELADKARQNLERLGYNNVTVRHGDGYAGWPEQAPFDVIIVAAAPEEVPQPLVEQLAVGGRLVLPVGDGFSQNLVVISKQEDGTLTRRDVVPVAFVPMTGKAQDQDD